MFFSVFCNIHRRSFVSFPHLIIHPAQDLVPTDNSDEGSQWVAPFYHEVLPRSQRIDLFHRAGSSHGKNLIRTRVSFSMRLQRVVPFHHPSICQLPTLQKTKVCFHHTLSGVLRTSFLLMGRCLQRGAPFYPLSQLSHSRDSDFHSFSPPGFLTSKMRDSRESLQ